MVERAKLHILDTLGAIVSGSVLEPGQLIIDFVRGQGGTPVSTVLASAVRTNAVQAALANGTMAHADETDDVHYTAQGHPGAPVLPAALAVGEVEERSGADLILAVVIGYDILCRTNHALDRNWMVKRGLNFRTISAVFGAAAVASRLVRLTDVQTRYALGFAGSQVSGLHTWNEDPRHVDKAVSMGGIPARNGVTAALWAKQGFTAGQTIFEGSDNVFQAFCNEPHPEALVRDLGKEFELLGTGIKKYPGGQPLQPTLEAYFILAKRHGLGKENVREVVVRLPGGGGAVRRAPPDLNASFILGLAVLEGRVDFHAAHDFERMHAPEVMELATRIRMVDDPGLSAHAAVVEVETRDGQRFSETVDGLPGAPSNPLTRGEIEEKFVNLCVPVLGARRTRRVVEGVRGLEEIGSVRELTGMMRLGRRFDRAGTG